MMKYSPLGHFSAPAASSSVSASSTSQWLPYTRFIARNAVAIPIVLAKNARRASPSFFARSSASSPISASTCFCCLFCGRGINSSFDTTCVGTGESMPSLRSRCHLGIHMGSSF
jgi:hypothetical protein